MDVELITLVLPLIITSILSITAALFVLKRKYSQMSLWFSLLMITLSFWSICYAFEITLVDTYLTLVFAKLKYVGIVCTPVFWLFFSLSYTKKRFTFSKKFIISILIIPIISLLTLFTNPFHHLFWQTMSFNGNNNLLIATGQGQLFFWIHTIYSYILILIGAFFVLIMLFRSKDIFTKQNMALLTGITVPFLGNITVVFNIIQTPYTYDITPFLFSVSGLAFTVAIIHFKFLELIPAARDEIFEHVTQAIFVLNKNMKIIDKNITADLLIKKGYLSVRNKKIIGLSIDSLLEEIFPKGVLYEIGIRPQTVKIQDKDESKWFEITLKPIMDKNNSLEGHLVTLDDITIQKNAEIQLRKKIDELKRFKQVTTDRELKMIELKKENIQLKQKLKGGD